MSEKIYHVGVSGGKDSTALLLWMIHESGIDKSQIIASFCDTQNEAPETYQHIKLLNDLVLPILTIETPGFVAITAKHGMFPNRFRRYCTKELKLAPTKVFLESLMEQNPESEIIAVSGVRGDESKERSLLPEWAAPMDSYFCLTEWRPLIKWTFDDVLAIHQKYGIPFNGLYIKGAKRVGCFPCIFSNKEEIRAMSLNSPERIEYISRWESNLSQLTGNQQTFFQQNKTPDRFKTGKYVSKNGEIIKVCKVEDVVRWSKTGHRAKGENNSPIQSGCISQSLACE